MACKQELSIECKLQILSCHQWDIRRNQGGVTWSSEFGYFRVCPVMGRVLRPKRVFQWFSWVINMRFQKAVSEITFLSLFFPNPSVTLLGVFSWCVFSKFLLLSNLEEAKLGHLL